jgi:hypothetical protein
MENKTIKEQIMFLAQCGGGLLNDKDVESLMPILMSKLQEQSDAIGYDGFSGFAKDYPSIIWTMVNNAIVKPTVLEWIDENCPKAWFRLMYETIENQEAFLSEQ